MKINFIPTKPLSKKCLVVVGGLGDTTKLMSPLLVHFAEILKDYTICSSDLSLSSESKSILTIQSQELQSVFEILLAKYNFQTIDLFCTSMGVFPTIKVLNNPNLANSIRKTIFFDPADYYIPESGEIFNDETWSGSQSYNPTKKVISEELSGLHTKTVIDVVHLILQNYSTGNYLSEKFDERGKDQVNGYPRLSTDMVKSFYTKLPDKNKGKYIEIPNIPHGFLRDGNIKENITNVTQIVSKLLKND